MNQNDTLTQALQDAATSLETISRLAGKAVHPNGDITCMGTFEEVRGYAISRASAARAALSARNPSQPLCRLRIGVDGKYVEATEGQGGFPVVLQQPCQASTPATYDALEFPLTGDASDGCGEGPAGEQEDQP